MGVAFAGLLFAVGLLTRDAAAQFFAGANLSLNSSTYYALLSDDQTRVAGRYLFSVGYSRVPSSQETIVITLSGSLNTKFVAARSSNQEYRVFTSEPLPAGRYTFDLIAVLTVTGGTSSLVTAAAVVEVFALNYSCVNQSFGICSQLCSECNTSVCKYGYQCSCLDGYTLQLDGYSCYANDPPPQVLLSTSEGVTQVDPYLGVVQQLRVITSSFDCSYWQHAIFYVSDNSSISVYDLNSGAIAMLFSTTASSILGLALDPADGNVLFCTQRSISKLYRETGLITELVSAVFPRAITVYKRLLLWAENHSTGLSDIKVGSMDGSNVTTVVSVNGSIVDMAVDSVTGWLYWITGTTKMKVQRSNLSGSGVKDIYVSQADVLVGVAVFEDFVYITSTRGVALKVDKFGRQGVSPLTYYTSPNRVVFTGSICVYHPLNGPILAHGGCSVNNGGCSHFCISTSDSYYCGCPNGYLLDVDKKTCINTTTCDGRQQGDVMNSSTAQCTCKHGYQIQGNGSCADINECLSPGTCSHVCTNTEGSYICSCPSGLYLASDQRTCSGCTLNNGGCSHLCMTSSDLKGYVCQCRSGYQLSSDGVSCVPNDVSQILLSTTRRVSQEIRGTVMKARVDGYVLDTLVDSISVADSLHTGLIYGMDFDLEHQVLYYGDRNSSMLWEVPLSRVAQGQDARRKLLDGVHAWSVSYDWVHYNLYWTDDVRNSISRTSLYPLGVAETVVSGLHMPCGLALDPLQGYVYWTESGVSPRICRMSMNSSAVEVLFDTDMVRPLGVTLDLLNGVLFWADPGKRSIEQCTLGGQRRSLVLSGEGVLPFQIAIHRSYLVWTSLGDTALYVTNTNRMNASHIGKLSVVNSLSETFPLYGMKIVNYNRRQIVSTDPCQLNPCPQGSVCTALGTATFTCGCPQGTPPTSQNYCSRIQHCTISSSCIGRDVCYNCTCGVGFAGEDCSVVVSDCSSFLCLNGATCARDSQISYCICAPGYEGRSCEAVCRLGTYGAGCMYNCTCMNNGTCNPTNGACTCPDGFGGQRCEKRICPPDYCFNGGTCSVILETNLQCRCPSTTDGDRCQFNNGPVINFQTKATTIGVPSAGVLVLLMVLVAGAVIFFCIRKRRTHKVKHCLTDPEANVNCTKRCISPLSVVQCKEFISGSMLEDTTPSSSDDSTHV